MSPSADAKKKQLTLGEIREEMSMLRKLSVLTLPQRVRLDKLDKFYANGIKTYQRLRAQTNGIQLQLIWVDKLNDFDWVAH